MKRGLQTTLLLTVLSISFSASAEESLPAVSAVNGKADYSGGWVESDESHNVSGSVSVPLGTKFGFQADGLYTHVSGRDFFGGGGHLFWRDPSIGLLGVSGGYITSENVLDSYHASVEGEYYFEHFTVGAIAGVGHISYDTPAPFISTDPTKFVGTLSLDWYAMDNLRLGVSYSYIFDNSLGQIQAEYQTPWKGLALTAEYARGQNDYDHALFGARFYFGKDKSLKERQRQDDPKGAMQRIFTSTKVYDAEYKESAREYRTIPTRTLRLVPESPTPGSGGVISHQPVPPGSIREVPERPIQGSTTTIAIGTGDLVEMHLDPVQPSDLELIRQYEGSTGTDASMISLRQDMELSEQRRLLLESQRNAELHRAALASP